MSLLRGAASACCSGTYCSVCASGFLAWLGSACRGAGGTWATDDQHAGIQHNNASYGLSHRRAGGWLSACPAHMPMHHSNIAGPVDMLYTGTRQATANTITSGQPTLGMYVWLCRLRKK